MHTTKDLANLLQFLQTSRQSGDLIVEPQVQGEISWQGQLRLVNGQVMACQVRRKIDGRVLLADNEALRWLINPQHGKLEWSLKDDTLLPDTFLPLLPTDSSTENRQRNGNTGPSFPIVQYHDISPVMQYNETRQNSYTTTSNKEQDLNTFPSTQSENFAGFPKRTEQRNRASESILSSRDHRQVFSLIDGNRTAEEIARLLHKNPELIFRVLSDLRTAGMLE